MTLSPPKPKRAGLCAVHAEASATIHSTVIQTIVKTWSRSARGMASATNNEGGFYHQEQILADVEAIEDQDDSIDLEYRGWQTERVSQRLRKAVALTLLLYAFLDVCVPGFCPFQMPVLSLERSAAHYSTVAAAKEPGDRPSPLDNDDEGCFCCSNRVIAVAHNFQFGDLPVDVIEFEAVPQQASLSIAPPHQPPRI